MKRPFPIPNVGVSLRTARIALFALFLATSVTAFAATQDIASLVDQASRYQSGDSRRALQSLETLALQEGTDPAIRQALEQGFIALLTSEESRYEAKRFACKQLAVIGSEASLPALTALLGDPATVDIACLALGSFPPDSSPANKALRDALVKARGAARIQIINTLAHRHDQSAVEAFIALAMHNDPATAKAAIAALGEIPIGPARQTLLGLIQQPDPQYLPELLAAALNAARYLATTEFTDAAGQAFQFLAQPGHPVPVRRGAFLALLDLQPDARLSRVLETLDQGDPLLTPLAIAAVPRLTAPDASEVLGKRLPTLSPEPQVLLIQALTQRGDAAAINAIESTLDAADPRTRQAALTALGQLGTQSQVTPLVRHLETTETGDEREATVEALTRLQGDPATSAEILRFLDSTGPQSQASLMQVLAARGDIAALPAILSQLENPNLLVTEAAYQAVGELAGAEQLPALLQALVNAPSEEVRPVAVNTVRLIVPRVEEEAARSAMLREALSQTESEATRAALLSLLPLAPNEPALKELKRALASEEPAVRDAALRALIQWPNLAAWDSLVGVYRQQTSATEQTLALRGLARLAEETNSLADKANAERYHQLLAMARASADRKLILGSLSTAYSLESLELARSLLEDPEVRVEAALAVRQIAEALASKHPEAARQALDALSN